MPPHAIWAHGRWSEASVVYLRYLRRSRGAAIGLSATIGSTAFEDVERGAMDDEELIIFPSEGEAVPAELIERELVDALEADEADGDDDDED